MKTNIFLPSVLLSFVVGSALWLMADSSGSALIRQLVVKSTEGVMFPIPVVLGMTATGYGAFGLLLAGYTLCKRRR